MFWQKRCEQRQERAADAGVAHRNRGRDYTERGRANLAVTFDPYAALRRPRNARYRSELFACSAPLAKFRKSTFQAIWMAGSFL